MHPHLDVRIVDIRPLTPTVKEFWLERLDGAPYAFAPGQHLMYWSGQKYAEFSLASSPTMPAVVAIAVRKLGQASSKLHALRVGDVIAVTPPKGEAFRTSHLAGRELWFVAGGIGLAGLKAQLHAVAAAPAEFPGRHKLFYGLKDRAELLWPDELRAWASWLDVEVTGDGRHLLGDLLHEGLGGHGQVTALICGPNAFYEPVRQVLLRVGVPATHILTNIWE